jgi:hypothetical protein
MKGALVLFVFYLLVIGLGLAYFAVIGLMGR